eukprot:578651-Lingulodinium_polyedra.AAC.1
MHERIETHITPALHARALTSPPSRIQSPARPSRHRCRRTRPNRASSDICTRTPRSPANCRRMA